MCPKIVYSYLGYLNYKLEACIDFLINWPSKKDMLWGEAEKKNKKVKVLITYDL